MKPISNPPNPWASNHVEWLGEPPEAELKVYEETARSILTTNDSPDVPFEYSVNPYRGCYHGCAYCYARPYHEYLDFGAGTDFERRIVVKTNAADLLHRAFSEPSWERESVSFSGITDCYQPLEASYGITRRCLEVCLGFGNPVGIITKGSLIRRDVDLLAELNERAAARVFVSIPFADDELGWAIEPHASAIKQRFGTLAMLAGAGVDVGVAIAPVIPGLNDSQIPEILERAADAGASRAFMIMLRLPGVVADVFTERIRAVVPDRADKILNAIRQVRGGELNNIEFGQRMSGQGPRWEIIRSMFHTHCKRLGLNERQGVPETPLKAGKLQGELFE